MQDKEKALELIEQHRDAIDDLDARIIALVNERAEHSLSIRALKPAADMQLYDPQREERIMQRLEARNFGPMDNSNLREIYATLLKVMKEIKA